MITRCQVHRIAATPPPTLDVTDRFRPRVDVSRRRSGDVLNLSPDSTLERSLGTCCTDQAPLWKQLLAECVCERRFDLDALGTRPAWVATGLGDATGIARVLGSGAAIVAGQPHVHRMLGVHAGPRPRRDMSGAHPLSRRESDNRISRLSSVTGPWLTAEISKILRDRNYSPSRLFSIVLCVESNKLKKIEMSHVWCPLAPEICGPISCVNRLASPHSAPERHERSAGNADRPGSVVANPNDIPFPLRCNGFGDHHDISRGTAPSVGCLRDHCPVSPTDEGQASVRRL